MQFISFYAQFSFIIGFQFIHFRQEEGLSSALVCLQVAPVMFVRAESISPQFNLYYDYPFVAGKGNIVRFYAIVC